jgi:hypothetical protein
MVPIRPNRFFWQARKVLRRFVCKYVIESRQAHHKTTSGKKIPYADEAVDGRARVEPVDARIICVRPRERSLQYV